MRTLVVVPAYNEAAVIAKTLRGLLDAVDADVLVVDDGSWDNTAGIASTFRRVRVARHMLNMGLGASLETGLEAARRGGYDRLVTFDADGQHNPEDVLRLIDALGGCDLAIGVRRVYFERMPPVKRFGNFMLNMLTWLIFGVRCGDSQSGLRAFNRKALESVRVRASRYEVSSEILYEASRNRLRVGEVPVEVIYTEHSIRRGTSVVDGFKILWRMILHRRI